METHTPEQKPLFLRRYTLVSLALAVAYGLTLRWLDGLQGPTAPGLLMTYAFLFGGPFVIGFLFISETPPPRKYKISLWIFGPWLPTVLVFAFALLFKMEGVICVVMAMPLFFLSSSLGGVAAGLLARRKQRSSRATTLCLAMLPLLLAPAEARLDAPIQTRTVESQIVIHAAADIIWRNIERVPAISPSEIRSTWAQRIGFPRPVEATLSYEGVGGVRHATFERGLLFVETVNIWEPRHRLAFTIRADSAHIPTTTLDEHVTIGSRYFDVLDGEYRLEPLADGNTLLHLSSRQRLSTDFNGYAGLWTDLIMQNLQTSILQVIAHRCENS